MMPVAVLPPPCAKRGSRNFDGPLELPSLCRRDAAAIPPGNEASHPMFFEFTRGRSLIDASRRAFDLEERFDNALRNSAMAWRQAVDRRLRRLGVSRVRWMTIAAAVQARSPLSQSILADRLAISRASMVKTVDCLVKNGLMKRESSASDRRLRRIVVTPLRRAINGRLLICPYVAPIFAPGGGSGDTEFVEVFGKPFAP